MIVLDKCGTQPRLFLEDAKVKTFDEKATVVTEDLGLDYQNLGDGGRDDIHW